MRKRLPFATSALGIFFSSCARPLAATVKVHCIRRGMCSVLLHSALQPQRLQRLVTRLWSQNAGLASSSRDSQVFFHRSAPVSADSRSQCRASPRRCWNGDTVCGCVRVAGVAENLACLCPRRRRDCLIRPPSCARDDWGATGSVLVLRDDAVSVSDVKK